MGHANFAQAELQTVVLPAIARFEFESGKGKEGSKVLMVEWDTSLIPHEFRQNFPGTSNQESHPTIPAWEVSWNDMPVTIAAQDRDEETRIRERQYFLLPSGCQIPTDITITHRTGLAISAKPLPAIYPEGLGLKIGSKGVLRKCSHMSGYHRSSKASSALLVRASKSWHFSPLFLELRRLMTGLLDTMWANNRVTDLEEELRNEMSVNVESVGLEMVIREKEWILDQFGIAPYPGATGPSEKVPATIVPPKHDLPGRLADQFRGLKIATSPGDFAVSATGNVLQAAAYTSRY